MNTILIYGNNKISTFLHTAFGESGLITVDITNQINSLNDPKDIYAVIDVSNADKLSDEATELIHNTGEIKELIDLASKTHSPYIFIYREREDTHPESSLVTALDFIKTYCAKKETKFALIQVEDIYGTDLNTSPKLEELINSITSGSNILTVDADDNEHYLLHQKDFIGGLKEIIKVLNTSPNSKINYFTLYPEDPITEIELAHFIKDLTDMDPEIVYTHEETNTSYVLPESETNYPDNWYPTIKLEEGLLDLFDYYGIPILNEAEDELTNENLQLADEYMNEEPDEEDDFFKQYARERDGYYDDYEPIKEKDTDYDYVDIPGPRKQPSTKGSSTKRKAIVSLTAALILALTLPSFVFAYNFGSGLIYINKAIDNIKESKLTDAYEHSNKASERLSKVGKIPQPISAIASLSGIKTDDQYLFIETTKEIAQAIHYLSGIDLYATLKSLESTDLASAGSNVLGVSTVAEPEYISKSLESIEKIDNNLESIETRNSFVRNFINENLNSLNKNKEKLQKVKTIEPVLGQLLGYNRKQTYLLLIQNLNVARSTGGKVEVYGILTASNGQLNIEKLDESKNAHDQIDLNGQIPAPESIKAITDQEFMYIEDISWEPDFKTAAILATNLYGYIGKEDLDGVVSVDTKLIGDLISTIGEIHIDGKTINAQNFNLEISKSENSQKLIKDTFTYVFETLKNNPESFRAIEPTLYSALNRRNMMIYQESESIYSKIIENNWAGILNGNNSDEYLLVTNNNLTDILSEQISAEILYEGTLPTDDNGYKRIIEVKYTNNSDADYLGHLMTLVPQDTLLNTAELNTQSGRKNIVRSIKNSVYGSKALYETDLYIPTKQSVTFKVEFQSPPKDYKDEYIDISLQKQPGSADIPLNIKLIGDNTMNTSVIFDGDKELKFPL